MWAMKDLVSDPIYPTDGTYYIVLHGCHRYRSLGRDREKHQRVSLGFGLLKSLFRHDSDMGMYNWVKQHTVRHVFRGWDWTVC